MENKRTQIITNDHAAEPIQGNIGARYNVTATVRDAETGQVKRVYQEKNLVATIGRAVIAQRLSNNLTYSGIITRGALGTSTTPPAETDVALGAEVYRKVPASQVDSANISYSSFFFTAVEVSGTFKEFATFIDGTDDANSGQLFNKVAVNWVKSPTETLTIDVENTIS
jgi:hypothetical protein